MKLYRRFVWKNLAFALRYVEKKRANIGKILKKSVCYTKNYIKMSPNTLIENRVGFKFSEKSKTRKIVHGKKELVFLIFVKLLNYFNSV